MIRRYNNLSLLWGVPGIIMQIGGQIMRFANETANRSPQPETSFGVLGTLIMLLGTAALLVGLVYYAKAKGRSGWWSLFAFLSIIGLIVLACLKDRTKE
jgi:hypothetical protein